MQLHVQVQSLHIFPIHYAKGKQVDSADLRDRGLEYHGVGDRRWAVVDNVTKKILTPHECPRLAMLETDIVFDGNTHHALQVNSPAMAKPKFIRPNEFDPNGAIQVMSGDTWVNAHLCLPSVHRWFSEALQHSVSVVHQARRDIRTVPEEYKTGGALNITHLGDMFPVRIANQATLDVLKGTSHKPIEESFCPNIVMSGVPAGMEQSWQQLSFSDAALELTKSCDHVGDGNAISIRTGSIAKGDAARVALREMALVLVMKPQALAS